MAFIPVINTAQVNMKFDLYGQIIENTLYFTNTDDPDVDLLTDLGNQLYEWASTDLVPTLSEELSLLGFTLTNLSSSSSPSIDVLNVPFAGSAAGTGMPNSATFCLQFKTPNRGRSYRGRNYIAGLSSVHLDTPNTVKSSFANDMVLAYQQLLIGGILTGGWTWVVVSRYTAGAPRTFGIVTGITSVGYADRNVDSQRRRLPGRGS